MDTNRQAVVDIVSRITKAPPGRLRGDTDLRTDLNVDSLQGLQIVAAIEKRFGVTVPDEEIDFYTSVDAIVETVSRLQGSPAGAPPQS
ncbi:MAG: acyl carrier protein [Acidobacteriota bacterium]